jgi:uncharacterized repeat protein (TIGR03803 family)
LELRKCLGRFLCVLLLCVAGRVSAQTFTVLTSLSSVAPPGGGGNLVWSPVQGFDGNFYGTTEGGGEICANNPFATCGVVFKVTPAGTLTVLHDFCQGACTDGGAPYSGLILSANGNFYGTTTQDEVNRGGTIYEITPAGVVTPLVSLTGQGAEGIPYGSLVQASGDFYGITGLGGALEDGTVYKVTPGGTLTTLHTFSGTDGDEIGLTGVGLLEGANGSFYGVTAYGTESSNGCGSIFKMSPQGVFTTLYGFSNTSTEGCGPIDGLVQTPNGEIYGTTVGGGAANEGTIFKMTAGGVLTSLYSFCIESNCADGSEPDAGMILGTDGNFYGTTVYGGANNQGEIFQITPEGAFKVLYSFCSEAGCADGRSSYSRLIQATDGNFYGATSDDGGGNNGGTFFKLSMGLAPFVETIPASGKVGTQVEILGSDLTGATSVSFNGTPAVFKVDSPTLIVATVPAKATTGKVRVSTPGGELLSNVAFRVSP